MVMFNSLNMKFIKVKTILNKHKRRDKWFLDDYSVNPYSGCSFNCIYCYIRGSKYGENLAKSLSVKVNAPEILERQLRRRAERGEYGIISFSSATEPYMPIEREFKLTRKLLKIILKYRFPVNMATKSTLILRDLDILKEIDKEAILPKDLKYRLGHGVIISISISTLEEKLCSLFEPNAPTPTKRLETVQKCIEEGFFCGVNLIPVLPYLSDSEDQLDQMIKTSKDYGAKFIHVGVLTLFGGGPGSSKGLYYKVLERHFPHLLPKYKRLYRIFWAPSKQYIEELNDRVKKLCVKHQITLGMLEDE